MDQRGQFTAGKEKEKGRQGDEKEERDGMDGRNVQIVFGQLQFHNASVVSSISVPIRRGNEEQLSAPEDAILSFG